MKEPLLLLRFLKLSFFFLILLGQLSAQKSVTITSSDGQALLGVEVYTKDYTFSAISNELGQVDIPKLQENPVIHFKYLGFEDLKIRYDNLMTGSSLIQLKETEEIIEEIIIVGRTDARQEDLPYTLDYIRAEEIAFTQPQTSADALQKNADIFVQKSQMGGGSPVIRGFEANRVLLVVDGVRMNNAIYRNGHLQNAITVDPSMLEQTEVFYGPGSLIYGSDALGGVVHFRSKNPLLNFDEDKNARLIGNAYTRYSSVNSEKSIHIDYNLGFNKWGSLTSISYSDFGDLKMGANRTTSFPEYGKRNQFVDITEDGDRLVENQNPNLQVGTAYEQLDVLQKFLFQPSEKTRITSNFQFSTSGDIPRYDALIEEDGDGLRYAEWHYGPQTRFLSSINIKSQLDHPLADEIILIPSYQFIEEDRINRLFGEGVREKNEENVHVLAFTVDANKAIGARSMMMYGLDLSHNKVYSSAFSQNIQTGATLENILTRYPGGRSTQTGVGLYGHFRWENPSSTVKLFTGARLNYSNTFMQFKENEIVDWPGLLLDGVNNENTSFTWSLGANFAPYKSTIIRTILSSAFRSPNVDDLAKIRVRRDEISFPNLELQPEKSINVELGITQAIKSGDKEAFIFNLTGFYTRLNDVIIRRAYTTPTGETIFINKGDTLAVVANINAQKAFIAGISSNIKMLLNSTFSLSAAYNIIKGRVINEGPNSPLDHIPPSYGKFDLSYSDSRFKKSLNVLFNGKKAIDEYGGSTDNIEFATADGALSWWTLNFHGSYQISASAKISYGIENILDKHYRPFASGLNGPGRNFILTLSTIF